jgi:cysteine desulfurase
MIYLDYSATTPVDKKVLDSFNKTTIKYIGNPNSHHKLGLEAKGAIDDATSKIASILNVKENEIVYTSGASESNNLAIKGIAMRYSDRGKHIITSELEHSSVIAPIAYLQSVGYEVEFVKLDADGRVDLEHFKTMLREDTILVSLASVNSEVGIKQPIKEIGEILKEYKNCFFHVDITQSIGKEHVALDNIDLASISAQKFYGLKGVGILYRKGGVILEPLIHGGRSTTVFRSGTPAISLIVSTATALELAVNDLDNKIKHVEMLNKTLKNELSKYNNVVINSNSYAIPHILNISVRGISSNILQHALEEYDIYISTQTACSSDETASKGIYVLTGDLELSNTSVRISLSHLTTKKEINMFIKAFDKCYHKLLV